MIIYRETPRQRQLGFPPVEKLRLICTQQASVKPDIVYRTCCVKLRVPSQKESAALLQVFKNNTLAAQWMLRDIREHNPLKTLASFRRSASTRYDTDAIAAFLEKRYRAIIRNRYALNASLFSGICLTLAAMIAGWLQKMAEAEQNGDLQRYRESAAFIIPVGKDLGMRLGDLGRKTIFGYAFLTPTRSQVEEAIRHLEIMLAPDGYGDEEVNAAARYQMNFGPRRRDRLGSMQRRTLVRLMALATRELARVDEWAGLRDVAQAFLQYTPPGFPLIKSDGLSPGRRRELEAAHEEALEEFGALPDPNDDEVARFLTEHERALFRQLQQKVFALDLALLYVPLRWKRADGCTRHRDIGLAYEPSTGQYKLLTYVLAADSRYREVLTIERELFDVNNPTQALTFSNRRSSAMLWGVECGRVQKAMLDQARADAVNWKAGTDTSGGCIRSGTLHAQYDKQLKRWWFEAHLSVGTKPEKIHPPDHVMGVHIDLRIGVAVAVLSLEGNVVEQFILDEACIARLLDNRPEEGFKPVQRRTAKERHHRLADALCALAAQHQALIGYENIGYRRTLQPTLAKHGHITDSYHASFTLLDYKLPLLELPKAYDIYGISPRRDCGACGNRLSSKIEGDMFRCSYCGHSELRYFNTAREAARRTLWLLANQQVQAAFETQEEVSA